MEFLGRRRISFLGIIMTHYHLLEVLNTKPFLVFLGAVKRDWKARRLVRAPFRLLDAFVVFSSSRDHPSSIVHIRFFAGAMSLVPYYVVFPLP
jgi:hypothetical protein